MTDLQVININKTKSSSFDGVQQINEVDEERVPLYSTKTTDQIAYVVSIGWQGAYISDGTRETYSTYASRLQEERKLNISEARRQGDSIIEHRLVFAHEKRLVKKIYS